MPSRLALAAALGLLATGCTLHSNPAADSVGRTRVEASSDAPRLLPADAEAPTVEVHAPVELSFDKKTYEAEAGTFNIAFTSEGSHNLNLVGPGVPEPLLWGEAAGAFEKGLTRAVTLEAGTYTLYCSVEGHRRGGMEAPLVVTS